MNSLPVVEALVEGHSKNCILNIGRLGIKMDTKFKIFNPNFLSGFLLNFNIIMAAKNDNVQYQNM